AHDDPAQRIEGLEGVVAALVVLEPAIRAALAGTDSRSLDITLADGDFHLDPDKPQALLYEQKPGSVARARATGGIILFSELSIGDQGHAMIIRRDDYVWDRRVSQHLLRLGVLWTVLTSAMVAALGVLWARSRRAPRTGA